MKKHGSKIAKARQRASSLSSMAIRDRVLGIAMMTQRDFLWDFKISEIVALARALKPFAKAAAKINQRSHGGSAPGRKSSLAIKITSRDLIGAVASAIAFSFKSHLSQTGLGDLISLIFSDGCGFLIRRNEQRKVWIESSWQMSAAGAVRLVRVSAQLRAGAGGAA